MKIKSLKLSNFASYGQVEVDFDENITYLIGKNGSGKSTIGITAIWFILAGIAEKSKTALIGERFRFIGNGAVSSSGELVLHDEKKNVDIVVKRRITKSANELSFQAPEGYAVDKEWLDNLFNVFLIAPKKFTELTSKQQAEALGLDTSAIDQEIAELKSGFTYINRDLSNLGQLVPVEAAEKVDVSELNNLKNDILKFNREQQEKQAEIDKSENGISILEQEALAISKQIDELKEKGNVLLTRITAGKSYVSKLPVPEDPKPVADIDEKLNKATETNEKVFKYEQYQASLTKQKDLEKKLKDNKKKQADVQDRRTNYIKAQKLPFDNLIINEEGELLLNNKPIREPYFSTGELLKIVPLLMSSKNPDLKYVFIQDFNLLDEEKQADIEKTLTDKGMQLVIELVGTTKIANKNCILLKDCKVVETYSENGLILA